MLLRLSDNPLLGTIQIQFFALNSAESTTWLFEPVDAAVARQARSVG
jgi:hypothetical protein